MIGDKQTQDVQNALSSSYYWEHIARIEGFLIDSRLPDTFLNPHALFLLQRDIVDYLSALGQTLRAGKKFRGAAEKEENPDATKQYASGLTVNKALVSAVQSVADGVAWRLLKFDRQLIRVMSAPKKPRGSVDLPVAYPGMEDAAIKLMYNNGSRIVFNDVTHYLRSGDLTEFLPSSKIIIHELKQNGKTVKNAYTVADQLSKHGPKTLVSKQMQNVIFAQKAFSEREISVNGDTVVFQDINLPFSTNLVAIRELISEARKSYFARTKFGNYLEVYCMDFKATIYNSLNREPQSWRRFDLNSSFDPSDVAVNLDSWDSWYEEEGDFTRNKTPYSVYPFSVSDCMGLISGELRLMSRLNLSELHRLYRASGWEVSAFGVEQLQQQHQNSVGARQADDVFNLGSSMKAFTISRNGFNMDVPLTMLLQIATDFVMPNLLLAMAENIYATSERGAETTMAPSFTSEKNVWI